jgi:succinate dehydrogenase / fumarate reductase flavoprotein subunit/fumarate reductase flavoprotein subunit
LFAAGEDAGGVHGANRLGGNGVADSIVFGGRAGDAMADYIASRKPARISTAEVNELAERWIRPLRRDAGENVFHLRQQVENLMWEKVGVVRNSSDLQVAISELQSLRGRAEEIKAGGRTAFNPEWNEAINLTNMTLVAEMIARSALLRTETRGAHYRTDHPVSRSAWLKNISVISEADEMKLYCRPVVFTRLRPPEADELQLP